MHGIDRAQEATLSREARAVLVEVDRIASVRRDLDAPAADLLSRVHEDLLALIDLLERDSTQRSASGRRTPAEDHVVRRGCRVLPGEI